MESDSSLHPWLIAAVLLVLVYRAATASLLEAFHALPSIQRRRMIEEDAVRHPRLADLLERPHAFGLGVSLWNQILLVLLLGLLWPLRYTLPGGAWTMAGLTLVYIWAMDMALPTLLTAARPAEWMERCFPFYAPVSGVLGLLVEPLARFVERRREAHDRAREEEAEEPSGDAVTALLEEGEAEGILEEDDRELIRNVVGFGDTVVREVMTPRTLIRGVEASASYGAVAQSFRQSRHSRLPVYQETVDRITGVLLLKDFLQLDPGGTLDLAGLAKAPLFVPESKPIPELLRELQRARTQMAIVVDEFGSVSGLATLEDLLEEVFGEIREEHEEDGPVDALPDGALLLPGHFHVEDLQARLGRTWAHEGYDTVAGLVMAHLGRVPRPGDEVAVDGARVSVVRMAGARVLQVRVEPGSALHQG